MINVYNLSTKEACPEYQFGNEVTPEWAVCYAYAEANSLMSLLFSVQQRNKSLMEHFPIAYGRTSVCCGDFAAAL